MDHWYRSHILGKHLQYAINQALNTPVIFNAYWHTTVSVIKNQFNPTFFLADCHITPLSLDLHNLWIQENISIVYMIDKNIISLPFSCTC